MDRQFCRLFACLCLFLCCAGTSASAQSLPIEPSAAAAPGWLEKFLNLPVVRWFEPSPAAAVLETHPNTRACAITPVPAISDASALAFESNVGSDAVVDLSGLTPATSHALDRFRQLVAKIGGSLRLTSAYRPSPYQEHLQVVWDKWKQLKNNRDASCQELRTEVAQEFTRHQLLESQRPVPFSDHTRGIGFDASLILPVRMRMRRRVSADSLARLAGLRRPDIAHDPVHFRFVGSRKVRA